MSLFVSNPHTRAYLPSDHAVPAASRFNTPPAGLGSGLSPPDAQSPDVRFGSVGLPAAGLQALTANAVSQLTLDAMGVWAPKMLVGRSLIQRVEDSVLEWGENALFYLTIPIMGQKVIGPLVSRLQNVPLGNLGTNYNVLLEKNIPITKQLLGAKLGAVAGALFVAAGLEYIVSFAKNLITVKVFHAKNFTAVAGLEKSSMDSQPGQDPLQKALRRIKQASVIAGGLVLASFALPSLVQRSKTLENATRSILKYMDFGGDVTKVGGKWIAQNHSDLTKPLLLATAGTGVISYLDACRDKLELKETAMRLSFVVPYMIAGKELTGNFFAKLLDRFSVIRTPDKTVRLSEAAPLLKIKNFGETVRAGLHHERFLNFNAVEKESDYLQRANQLAKQLKLNPANAAERLDRAWQTSKILPAGMRKAQPSSWPFLGEIAKLAAAKNPFERRYYTIGVGKYLISAVGLGVIINLLAYAQTRHRYENARREAWANLDLKAPAFSRFRHDLTHRVALARQENMLQWMVSFAGRGKAVTQPA